MSVIQLNPESFKKNVYGISRFSHKYNYGRTILFDEIEPVFNTLQAMNAKSYSTRYNDSTEYIPYSQIDTKEEHNNLPSLLKSLQCLVYNIDLDKMSFDEKQCLETLESHIDSIKSYLINQITEYQAAQWS